MHPPVCTIHQNGQTWFEEVHPFLAANRYRYQLLLGIGSALGADPKGTWLATVKQDDELVGVALKSPDFKVLLSDMPEAAVSPLLEALAKAHANLPGVHASPELARAVARRWAERMGVAMRDGRRQRVHILHELNAPLRPSTGSARLATEADVELVHGWIDAFLDEVGGEHMPNKLEGTHRRIAQGQVVIWDDPAPVSMAARVRELSDGAAVSLVYTPPASRGKGYASHVVYEVTKRILDDGKSFATLYTDLDNPTSNSIYAQLGYQGVADELEIFFDNE